MGDLIQFVDSISASPTVLLDLNNEAPFGVAEWSAPPPPLRQFGAGASASRDGDPITGSTYGNRTISMTLDLPTTTQDLNAASLQTLARILDKPSAILRYKPTGMTAPVFFQTYRADVEDIQEVLGAVAYRTLSLSINAKPFAVGLREDVVASVVVTNDPEAATRGMFLDVSAVKGDVPTPPVVWFPSNPSAFTSAGGLWLAAEASPPGNAAYRAQLEGGTLGADTSAVADATASAGSKARTTFSTDATLVDRVTGISLANNTSGSVTGSIPAGSYRAFVRVSTSGISASFTFRLGVGGINQPTRTWISPAASNVWVFVDLGVVQLPGGNYPKVFGLSDITATATSTALQLAIQSGQGSSASLSADYLYLLPASASSGTVTLAPFGIGSAVIDGVNDSIYQIDTASPFSGGPAYVSPTSTPLVTGSLPVLYPGLTTRLHLALTAGQPITTTRTVSVSYWPLYLYVRPATT